MHFLDWLDRQIASTSHYWCADEFWWPVECFADAPRKEDEWLPQSTSQTDARSLGAQH